MDREAELRKRVTSDLNRSTWAGVVVGLIVEFACYKDGAPLWQAAMAGTLVYVGISVQGYLRHILAAIHALAETLLSERDL